MRANIIMLDWSYWISHPSKILLVIFLSLLAVYVVVRLGAIAWYKTKRDYELDYFNHVEKDEESYDGNKKD